MNDVAADEPLVSKVSSIPVRTASPKSTVEPHQQLRKLLKETVVPSLRRGNTKVVLAEPPIRASEEIEVVEQPGVLLQENRANKAPFHTVHWPEQRMYAMPYPYLGFVAEGEADLVLGATTRMASVNANLKPENARVILRLRAGTLFLIPSGVPRADGTVPHWEQSGPVAASHILWMQLISTAAMVHSCTTRDGKHFADATTCIRDDHGSLVMELMVEMLRRPSPHTTDIVTSYFLAMLLHLEDTLESGQGLSTVPENPGTFDTIPVSTMTVRRACRYINTHLMEPVTLAGIAAYAQASVPHLCRLFRAEMGMPVMKYVTERRMESVQTLLTDTDLSLHDISKFFGFSHPAHFSRTFLKWAKTTPGEYRKRHRLALRRN